MTATQVQSLDIGDIGLDGLNAVQVHALTPDQITLRLFLPMLLEATRVLEEGIVAAPHHVDMGVILGIGFPPFRGGILHWCDTEGASAIADRLGKYASLGKRFEPTDSINSKRVFFPRAKAVA